MYFDFLYFFFLRSSPRRVLWFVVVWAVARSLSIALSVSFHHSTRTRIDRQQRSSLTCYCTALLSAFELFAHESVDLLTAVPWPGPGMNLPGLRQRRQRAAWLLVSLFYFFYLFIFVSLFILNLFAGSFWVAPVSAAGKMRTHIQQKTLCSRFFGCPVANMGVDL